MTMHTGHMQSAITSIVDHVMGDHVMDLSREAEPWEILAHACNHLCARSMRRGDVQAWYVMANICDELLKAPGYREE